MGVWPLTSCPVVFTETGYCLIGSPCWRSPRLLSACTKRALSFATELQWARSSTSCTRSMTSPLPWRPPSSRASTYSCGGFWEMAPHHPPKTQTHRLSLRAAWLIEGGRLRDSLRSKGGAGDVSWSSCSKMAALFAISSSLRINTKLIKLYKMYISTVMVVGVYISMSLPWTPVVLGCCAKMFSPVKENVVPPKVKQQA